jgi:hypothetical protein
MVEFDACIGHRVDVRRGDVGAIAGQVAIAEVIGKNEDDIRLRSGRLCEAGAAKQSCPSGSLQKIATIQAYPYERTNSRRSAQEVRASKGQSAVRLRDVDC